MTVAYDGTGFSGFSENLNVKTVGGELKAALATVLRHPVNLIVAGRTDAGVHAWGNVVSFDAENDIDLASLQRHLNSMLGPAIVIREAEVAPEGFNARRWAVARRYRYTVLNRPVPDPFLATTTWHVEAPLDLATLRLACDPIIGEHDFSSFCRVPKRVPDASLVRLVYDARWLDLGDGRLRFDIDASSFCQQMVRSLVGTMVPMGLGRERAGQMAGILRARTRSVANRIAPARGLCLWEVVYPEATTTSAAPPRVGATAPRSHWRDRGAG
ncbi:MAG TPA: tRNA pseudouridine(38-40) synthase TruA [Acidimicrobiales bacterium]|nr:tRNA pseudouridine(38-40) synthase TruA [Acidimicrobiales bacterium]